MAIGIFFINIQTDNNKNYSFMQIWTKINVMLYMASKN